MDGWRCRIQGWAGLDPDQSEILDGHSDRHDRLTASSTRNTFLLIFVTICDAQNQPSHCNLYANVLGFIAHSLFLRILEIHLCYKGGPYLTQSVYVTSVADIHFKISLIIHV